MTGSAPLDAVPLWALFAAVLIGILFAIDCGFRLGRWRRNRSDPEKESPVSGMVAAELGLLAFLLAFTFGFAASKHDDRRKVLLDESNAIGTAYLRAAMLPEPHRTTIRQLLREYVDVRIAGVQEGSIEEAIRRSEELQVQLWDQTTAATEKDTHSIPTGLFVQALNDVIDLHAKRLQVGLRSRIPPAVLIVLLAVTVLSFSAMGYHGGLTGTTRSPVVAVVALTFAVVILLILDLDRPQQGFLRVNQLPMIELQKSMAATQPR